MTGVMRPVIHGEILTGTGTWILAPFLMDTGEVDDIVSGTGETEGYRQPGCH